MVKLTYLIKKRPDLTREAFLQYWHISYTNLIRGMSASLGLKKYVIHMRLETPSNILVRLERVDLYCTYSSQPTLVTT